MDLRHTFTVPTPVEETWAHFGDLGALAECFPGATIGDYDEQRFTGSVKVKLGPIALVYTGSGTFVEKDEAEHRFVVEAKGKDKRGNGTAGATVRLAMADVGGSTQVEVLTDLNVTGKPAQFGRGVMQDVSDKLLGQFVDCLEQRLSAGSGPEASAGAGAAAAVAQQETPAGTSPGDEAEGEPALAAASPAAPGASGTAAPSPAPATARPTSSGAGSGSGPVAAGETLDLGATVLPVLARAYWKQGAAAAALVLLGWLLGRRG